MFSLRLFGVVSLAQDGASVAGPAAQRRRLALLALLAAGPEGGVSREKLVGYLWPDTDSDQARRFLADSLYTLRKALGQNAILAVADNLQLNPAVVQCDVVEFRRALALGDTEAAVRLYGGAFLDGFFLPDAADFGLWSDTERAELSRKHVEALERLARQAETRGNHAQAAAWWRQLQAADPLNSRVALELMTALEASGDYAAALRHVEVHETLLREELGIGPGPALAAFTARLRASAPAPAPSSPHRASAVRRDETNVPTRATPATSDVETIPAQSTHNRFAAPRAALWAALVVLVVAVGGVVGMMSADDEPTRDRVSVSTFENRTGDRSLDPVGRMAADWIARGLMQTGILDVGSPTWAFYTVDSDAQRATRSIAEHEGAGTLVSGAYYLDGGRLRFEAEIIDVVRGTLLHSLDPITVDVDSGTAGVELLRQRVAVALAARFGESQELREITARAQPPVYAAYLDYVEGVELFSRFQTALAAQRFERAWALDSTFHLARLFSVLVAYSTGQVARGDSLVRQLTLQRDQMALFDRSLLEVFQAESAGDQTGVLRALRSVAEMTPGSQFAVGHAVAAISSNRPHEALDALLRVNPEVGLVRASLRYWDWLTTTRHLLGDHRRELQDARKGRAQHPDLPVTLYNEIRALAARGQVNGVERLLEESLTLSGDVQRDPERLMRDAAAELRAHGHEQAGARYMEQALTRYAARPADQRDRLTLARMLYDAERWEEARALFQTIAAERPPDIMVLGYLGTLAARRGDHSEADRIASALTSAAQPNARGAHIVWRARIVAQRGEVDQAMQLLREALSQGVSYGLWLHTDADLAPLRADRSFRKLLRPAD